MGEKVIVASRPVVVTLVICGKGGEEGWTRSPEAKNLPKSLRTPNQPCAVPSNTLCWLPKRGVGPKGIWVWDLSPTWTALPITLSLPSLE